jgi:hypothetical protein
MAYIINRFNGTQLAIVDDGILDNSTPLGLIGRNYTGYGEIQNENFVFLLENFANDSPPARALSGQIWYNTTERALKTYNGTSWLSIGNATVSETEPAHSSGGLWLNSVTQQMYVSDGTTWRLVGPEGVDGFAVTKMTSVKIRDSLGVFKPVIISQINGETTTILSNEAFVINAQDSIPGFSQLSKGINLKSDSTVNGNVQGNADTATRLETTRTINDVAFNGTSNITVTSNTNQPLKPGDYILGSEFNGAFVTTWDIDATPNNQVGKVVARDSTGSFSATTVTAEEFVGDVLGNVTTVNGTSTFNNIVVDTIIGNSFSGLSGRATRLETPRLINTVPFDGTSNLTLPVPAETLIGNTLAANIVASSLTTLGQLEYLSVEAPGITVGDGNNLNIKIEGFTPTIESDTTNILKLKLATGGVVAASSTTLTFLSSSAAAVDGVVAPAFVPDYTLGTSIDNSPVLGLPSYRWKNIYSKAANLDTLNVTTLSGRTVSDQVVVSKDLVVNGAMFGSVIGRLTGPVTGAASLNLLKSGDGMTGDISWSTTGRGLSWGMNTDGASIRFYNSVDGDTNSRLEFNTSDNNDEYFRWTHTSGASTYESMRLTPTSSGLANLRVSGQITVTGGVSAATYIGDANQLTNLNATQLLTGTVPSGRLAGSYNISIVGNVAGNVSGNVTGNVTGNLTGNVTGNVTGASSLNVLKSGDTMSGDLNWSTTGRGLTWGMNTDGASIRFYNSGDGDTASRLEFQTTDNGNEYFSWTHALSGGATIESMRLVPNSSGNAALRIYGNVTVDGTASGTFSGTGTGLSINAGNLITGIVPTPRLSGTYNINISGNAATATVAGTATANIQRSGDTMTGRLGQSTSGFHAASKEVISTRTDSGFYDWPNPSTANGWPVTGSWYHLLSSTHVNDANYYAMQLSADFYGQNLYYRSTAGNGNTAWSKILHSNNWTDYAPTKTGAGASGTWAINISGNAATVTSVPWTSVTGKPSVVINDGGTYGINISGTANSLAGGAGDSSYLRFRGYVNGDAGTNSITGMGMYGVNMPGYTDTVIHFGTAGGSSPAIQLRANYGDSLWFRVARDSETQWDGVGSTDKLILHSGNYNSFSPTLTGGNASGTWGISISGNANSVTAISSAQVTNALGYTPVNPATLTNQSGSVGNFSSVTATTGNFNTLNFTSTLLTGVGNLTPNQDLIDDNIVAIGDAQEFLRLEGAVATTTNWLNYAWLRGNWSSSAGVGGLFGIEGNAINALRVAVGLQPSDSGDTIFLGNTTSAGLFYNGLMISENTVILKGKKITIDSEDGQAITVNASIRANIIGNVTGNASSASSVAWNDVSGKPNLLLNDGATYGINISGNANTASSTSVINNAGNIAAESNGTGEPSGLRLRSVYTNGYPTSYGNAITLGGAGGGELLVGWSGSTGGHADNYVRSRRDTGNIWSPWAKLITDVNYNSHSPSLTGTGASGTWPISINGNAATVSTITSGQIAGGLGYTPISKSGDTVNGELNLQDNNLKRATIIDYSLAHNALGNVSGGVTVNMELGNYASATAVGALTWTFANPPTGARAGSIILELTNGGAFTQYWPASVRWPAGAAPSLAAAGVDVLVFITDDGGSNWRGAISMGDSR